MSGNNNPDPCANGGDCLVPPAEFVRLRYFFGQRLGVVDLFDEQAYVVGKQRFHNLLLHGAGVLCGLQAQRQPVAQGAKAGDPTTLLRVSRGAALDACGREIVVGWDCCIDVNAWYLQHPAAHPVKAETTSLVLWVALCYRECPSDPAPAPRDPCGCDAGGCEFARIREGFELRLLTEAEAGLLAPVSLAAGVCPQPPANPCLLLASFEAELAAGGQQVVNLGAPDNAIPERLTLLPTALLQQRLLGVAAAAEAAGLVGDGPSLAGLSFIGSGPDGGTLSIGVALNGAALPPAFIDPASLTISVFRFRDDGSWESLPPPSVVLTLGPAASIDLQFPSMLVDGGRYRVHIETNRDRPPTDLQMRPLRPASWASHFRLVLDSGSGHLVLADSLYP